MNGRRATLRRVGAVYVAALCDKVAALTAGVTLARVLGGDALGQVGILRNAIGLVSAFGGSHLALASAGLVSRNRADAPERVPGLAINGLAVSIGASCSCVAVTLLFPGFFAEILVGDVALSDALGCAAGAAVGLVVTGVGLGILDGRGCFTAVSRLQLVNSITALAAITAGAWLGGVRGAMWATSLQALVIAAVVVASAVRGLVPSWSFAAKSVSWNGSWTILVASAPLVGSGLLVSIAHWYGIYVVGQGPDAMLDVGLISIANQWRLAIVMLPQVIARVFMPRISDAYSGTHPSGATREVWNAVALALAATSATAIGLGLAARHVLAIYGTEFVSHTFLFVCICFSACGTGVTNVMLRALIGIGKNRLCGVLDVVWAVSHFVMARACVTQFGAAGYGYAVCASTTVQLLVVVVYVVTYRPFLRGAKER